jgi:translocation and assembly module TamB
MSRARRIVRIVAASLAGLLLVVVVAGIVIVQTQWFRNMVRTQIVGAVEEATGGTAAVGAFTFDWRHLRAQIRDFTIHGLEGAGGAPLFHANLVQVDLKVTSPFHGFVDIAYLLLDTPQARVIVYPDGHTNIPAPKVQAKSSGKTGLETIVDLAIGHFDLRNGSLSFGDQKTALNASGANVRAQLGYNLLDPSYTGEIDISPLHVHSDGNAPLDVDIMLPVTAHKDELQIANAQFSTPQSHIVVSGAMSHLIDPRTSAHLSAQISLDEARRVAGLNMPLDLAHGPRMLMADVTASMDQQAIHLQSARITLGNTNLEASGNLKEANGGGGATFNASLDLGELGRLLRVAARPEGTVKLGGTAHLDAQNNYSVAGNIEARRVAFRQGATRISDVSLDSSVAADPRHIALSNLRLDALGGRFVGAASLQDMAAFQVEGRLQGLDIESMGRTFLQRKLGYNGMVSGPIRASGNVNRMADLTARVNLAISPAPRRAAEIPVAGRINADYNAHADTVTLGASYIALPHTRVDLSGQLGRKIDVKLVSRSFADFQPLAEIPVTLAAGGSATVNATVSGNLSAPRIAGNAAMNNFAVQGRPFTRFSTDIAASPSSVALTNTVVARGALEMQLSASAGLHDWMALPSSPVHADATVRNADVKDVLALAGEASTPVTGAFTMDAHINGTMGSPVGTLDAAAANGSIDGEKYENFTLRAQMTQGAITVPTITLTAGASRIDANGVFQHPVNDLQQGTITAHVAGNQIQFAQFQSLIRDRPGLQGTVTLNGDGSATLRAGQFAVSSLKANVAARGLAMEGKLLGDITATADTAGTALRYNVSSNFAGSAIRVDGESDLNGDHRTSANASVSNLPIDRVLAVTGQRNLPVKGSLSATAQVSGTLQDLQATANFTITNGAAYQEPFTRLQADVNYTSRALNVPRFHIEDGAAFVDASLAFTHPANDFEDGDVQLHMNSNQIQLARLKALQQSHPGLAGAVQLTADAVARLHKNAAPQFSTLNANLRATGVSMNKQNLGDLTANATTRGNAIDFNLTSDLAHSDIKGSGSVELTSGYPINARVTFANLTYRGLSSLLSPSPPQPFDASVEGSLSVSGPAGDIAGLSGTLELTKLEAHSPSPAIVGANPRVALDLKNAGNITAALNRGTVTIQNFRLTGRDATLSVSGTAALAGAQSLGLQVNGNVNLEMLEAFNPEIYSSGAITLNAAIAGTAANPDITGRLQLQKASFNMLELPNGLSNATGTVAFTGSEAYIQNITGESGGGKVTLSGTVGYGGPQMQFHLQAAADGVHIQYPDTITTQLNANLILNGTSTSSLVTGRVSIVDVALHSGADIGNVLTAAASPPSAPSGTGGPLAGMRFAVRIATAPDAQFRTTLTQNLQADAHLTLLGTPDNPGMLGRVTVTEGDVVFFGSKYTIDEGTITFSDASKINPVLNIDLETTVQGVDVALTVSGPVDKMKLSYRSDPPLQFQQIVSLLASGTTPTTDPVLAAHAPVAPQQNLEQSGASTLLGQAVANPVSGRLQRLFGVSKLSIDPQIVGTTNTAQATLTLQQQITRDITFTYIEDVTQSNPQVIRAEWAISPRYSAVAQRDVNGEVTVDLFYKRRFH